MVLYTKGLRSGIIPFLLTKLAGAGLSMAVFFAFILQASRFDLFQWSEELSRWMYWGLFFGYGIACSFVIDGLTFRLRGFPRLLVKIGLYVIAGFAFFIFKEVNGYTLFAGTVGAACALIFYFGTYASRQNPLFKYIFAVGLPLLFLLAANLDFTKKADWEEERTASSYSASFSYFNGKHEIPVRAKEGQSLTISIGFHRENEGGYGFHMLNDHNQYVGLTEAGGGKWKLSVPKTGVYKWVVTGDGLRGSFEVLWHVEE
ncbi:hypothetical protein [Paenibacillus sp. J2TS4]|uniref:hypothetical protein n=1 Tax=Paenibacillus sp. J2TS4 TaxID=2807194 RepID=UPI001B28716F|nr:hypothetical protein [Paenibacillus sp. J2TS4]GIP34678.1 hypothetical protein J2TS4_38880 [Paenibacillus sp. J2TS4]